MWRRVLSVSFVPRAANLAAVDGFGALEPAAGPYAHRGADTNEWLWD